MEALLERKAKSLPNVSVQQGWEAIGLRQFSDHCEVTLRKGTLIDGVWSHTGEEQTVQARYVVGVDGANSFVIKSQDIKFEDMGFEEDWLVIDLMPHAGVELDVPDIGQWCNPARPTTMVPGGPGYRRWEFMRLPSERVEDLMKIEKVWELLARWISPEEATLVRHAVYKFRSLIAEKWRHDRVLLAGDAAHQMPPFMGQGLCSGLRDAWNLGWRFDFVLKGLSPPQLLDGYTKERRPQVRAVIEASIAMGQVVCISDLAKAAQRDEAYLSGLVAPLPPFPGLTDGMIHQRSEISSGTAAGLLSVHGIVKDGECEMRFDDAVSNGFHLLLLDTNPEDVLDERSARALAQMGGRAVGLTQNPLKTIPGRVLLDVSGKYKRFFAEHDVTAVIVRPDYYVFGAVRELTDVALLMDSLASCLALGVHSERSSDRELDRLPD